MHFDKHFLLWFAVISFLIKIVCAVHSLYNIYIKEYVFCIITWQEDGSFKYYAIENAPQ